jgi:hypothetical protein
MFIPSPLSGFLMSCSSNAPQMQLLFPLVDCGDLGNRFSEILLVFLRRHKAELLLRFVGYEHAKASVRHDRNTDDHSSLGRNALVPAKKNISLWNVGYLRVTYDQTAMVDVARSGRL